MYEKLGMTKLRDVKRFAKRYGFQLKIRDQKEKDVVSIVRKQCFYKAFLRRNVLGHFLLYFSNRGCRYVWVKR